MAKATVTLDNFEASLVANMKRLEEDPKFRHDILDGHPEGNPVTLGPRVTSAADWANKQITNSVNAADTWFKNVLAPRKDPKKAALAAAGKWKTNVQAAIAGGYFEKGINAYDESAKEAVITSVGAAGFSAGVTNKKAKAVSKINKLQPKVAALAATLDAMPQDTDAQREAKMIAAKRGMQQIGKDLRGG